MTEAHPSEETKTAKRAPAAFWLAACVLWLAVVAGGTWLMLAYSESAGVGAKAPLRWPRVSHLIPAVDRPTLLMFVHPHCPCSRASVTELDRLVARGKDRFSVRVLFVKPQGVDEGWLDTQLFRQASAIPGVQVAIDHEGQEAVRFNAITSGQTLLYDRDGSLLFEGGITPARGHEGDSAGRAAVLGILEKQLAGRYETPVFGCELCEKGGAQ